MNGDPWVARELRVLDLTAACDECAWKLEGGGGEPAAGSVNDVLARTGLPHLSSDELIFGAERPQAGDTLELSRLIERIGMLVPHLDRSRSDHRLRARAARLLGDAAALLRRHVQDDRECWAAMRETLPGAELTARLEAADTAEARAAHDLRFIWQPPVPATVATALRHHPWAKRVLVLGGDHPEGPSR